MKILEHELEEILKVDLGLDKVRRHVGRKGINFMMCCPFHGESKPSAGIVLGDEGVFGQCFSCEETFGLPKLVAHVKGMDIRDAINYLDEKYKADFRVEVAGRKKLRRYEEVQESHEEKSKRFELPRVKLAPLRSGKETHKYFFDRGFTKQTVEECKIGWDREKKRVTIPIFHRDGKLAGIIGRAVLEQGTKAYKKVYGNQPKYYIYYNFPIGEVLYGSHEFYSEEDTAIIVEGTLDRLWLRQLGFTNVLSIIVAKMSLDKRSGVSYQAEILHELGVKKVIFMHDNDKAGEVGKKVAHQILKDDFICYEVPYPEEYKDPVGMSKEQIDDILDQRKLYGKKKLKRI